MSHRRIVRGSVLRLIMDGSRRCASLPVLGAAAGSCRVLQHPVPEHRRPDPGDRLPKLRQVINLLDADVMGLQEEAPTGKELRPIVED